jgi:phosphoribosylanthranilate isomerase
MLVKICGINDLKFLQNSASLQFNFAGFIFYPESARDLGDEIMPGDLDMLPVSVERVGVFVNEPLDLVVDVANQFALDFVQLHGDEDSEYAEKLAQEFSVIKAFRVSDEFDFSTTKRFEDSCDYFLFDTRAKKAGGTGLKFNWNLLEKYKGEVPFLLSGGIGPEDVKKIKEFSHPKFVGIDINSKFETTPGKKDLAKISHFLKQLA